MKTGRMRRRKKPKAMGGQSTSQPQCLLWVEGGRYAASESKGTKAHLGHDYESRDHEQWRAHQSCHRIEPTDEQSKRPAGRTQNVEQSTIYRWTGSTGSPERGPRSR